MSKKVAIQQGSILKVEKISFPVLVVSKPFFNESGLVIACPIIEKSVAAPLHIKIEAKQYSGFVHCEDLKLLDIKSRRHSVVDSIEMSDIINISDAIQGIFDYI